jgi:hypothetical protein
VHRGHAHAGKPGYDIAIDALDPGHDQRHGHLPDDLENGFSTVVMLRRRRLFDQWNQIE